jgi:hypothetical protein
MSKPDEAKWSWLKTLGVDTARAGTLPGEGEQAPPLETGRVNAGPNESKPPPKSGDSGDSKPPADPKGGNTPPSKPPAKSVDTAYAPSDHQQPKPNPEPAQKPLSREEVLRIYEAGRFKELPPTQKIKIETPNGIQEITVAEYRNRHAQATAWLKQNPGKGYGTKAYDPSEVWQQAAKKFGLDKFWYREYGFNPYLGLNAPQAPQPPVNQKPPPAPDPRNKSEIGKADTDPAQAKQPTPAPKQNKSNIGSGDTDPAQPAKPGQAPKQPAPGPGQSTVNIDAILDGVAALEGKLEVQRNKVAELQKRLEKGPSNVDELKIREELKLVRGRVAAIEAGIEAAAQAIEASPLMKGFKGSNPGETFKEAHKRFSKGDPEAQGRAAKILKWLGLFSLLAPLGEILTAETADEKIQKAMAAVHGLGSGIMDVTVIEGILGPGSGGAAMGILFLLGLCGEGGCQPDPEALKEALKRAARDQKYTALSKYMKEMHPEAVIEHPKAPGLLIPETGYRKLWEETEKKLDEIMKRRKDGAMAKGRAERAQQMRAFGVQDGITGEKLHDKVGLQYDLSDPALADAAKAEQDIRKGYEEGYKEGEAQKAAALKRAREIGLKDGKTGKPAQMEEIATWPVVKTSQGMTDREQAARAGLAGELLGAYQKAFDSVAPPGARIEGAGTMTAGQKVERDKKEAALKRAKQYGLEDGKTGKQARIEEIQKWKEVTDLEGTARAAVLHELIETYNKAFASVAPANAKGQAKGTVPAREKIAADRKEAALKRAWSLGKEDGTTGVKLNVEKIQNLPEIADFEGAERGALVHKLLEAYNKAYDSVPKKAGLTGGEKVARDKKADAITRAREMGTRDGKAGKRLNVEDIQDWPVVTELEGPARGTFLHELIETYNKAFEAVPKRQTAGERVAEDKKNAAIERARQWGLKDGKAGKISDMTEINTWPGMADMDPVARGPFIAQLIGIYNKAQAEASAAKNRAEPARR